MAKLRRAGLVDFSSFKTESLRGNAGFYRVGQTQGGQWWMIDPEERPFFMKAVGRVAAEAGEAAAVLRSWGMNTIGPGSEAALVEDGFGVTENVDFCAAGAPVIHAAGVRLPDVFDPGWAGVCEARAAVATKRWCGRRELVGYFTDDALGWGEMRADRPGLLQLCLSLEPSFPAYHAAWEFVLAPHGGELAGLARAWGIDLANREGVRQRTVAERPLATPGYLRDQADFSKEFAHRYFKTTAAALRRHDPDHLILGCRFGAVTSEAVLAECVYPHVDVVSWQGPAAEFAGRAAHYARERAMPLAWTGVGQDNERLRADRYARSGPTRIERMLSDRRRALTAACVHPAVVGYEWARWRDEQDDVPPFGAGLVHVDLREATEHTELLAQLNARAESRRSKASLSPIK